MQILKKRPSIPRKRLIRHGLTPFSLTVLPLNTSLFIFRKASSYNLFNTLLIAFSRLVPIFIHVTEFTIWNKFHSFEHQKQHSSQGFPEWCYLGVGDRIVSYNPAQVVKTVPVLRLVFLINPNKSQFKMFYVN